MFRKIFLNIFNVNYYFPFRIKFLRRRFLQIFFMFILIIIDSTLSNIEVTLPRLFIDNKKLKSTLHNKCIIIIFRTVHAQFLFSFYLHKIFNLLSLSVIITWSVEFLVLYLKKLKFHEPMCALSMLGWNWPWFLSRRCKYGT